MSLQPPSVIGKNIICFSVSGPAMVTVYFPYMTLIFLKKINSYSKQGNGMQAIRAIHYPNNLAISDQKKPIISKTLLGDKWRNNRLKLGLSIDQVANKTGISPSYLHKIENAQTKNVSFDILQKLASFYNENILSYYDKYTVTKNPKVKSGAGDAVSINIPGVSLQSITRCRDNQLTSMIYTIEPGYGRLETSSHNGEELVYILNGTVEFFLEDKSYMLSLGDSLHFKSQTKHRWLNVGKTEAKLLWIYTPEPK
ncbi:HTH-type transcriptional regulator PuuR [Budvicia aquatica]|uniref:HTH-type transcriptional regulator PuuR n=2 Tax=Budvicia aquatica TaxID=82979 RepID=A0A484ZVX8_9GAMM|nr:XRE family transcriptional regulator [Budvicia aquatica]VFS51938.1 HTH-type transcriptional regulator PuuR [Budvicia aquatica]